MASSLMRGLFRSGRPLQRPGTTRVGRARCCPGESAAGLICTTHQWAEQRGSIRPWQRRSLHNDAKPAGDHEQVQSSKCLSGKLDEFKRYFEIPPASPAEDFKVGATVTIHGFLSKRRDMSQKMTFVDLLVDMGPSFQFVSSWEEIDSSEHKLHQSLKSLPAWSPVALTGRIDKYEPLEPCSHDAYELTLHAVQLLNPFPKDIIISEGALFPPKSRHLQLRFDKVLQDRLRFRHDLAMEAQNFFRAAGFLNVETPVLFKSTPEGAREFLVPTRRRGYAYALPQSPQQYKQILMASGVHRYFQFARCFRDEDLRADRQPEFTQLDLEMSFATGQDVMTVVERFIWHICAQIKEQWRLSDFHGLPVPCPRLQGKSNQEDSAWHAPKEYPHIMDFSGQTTEPYQPFSRIPYEQAMSLYGSDKPDLRIRNVIKRVDVPATFASMITDLENPIVEVCIFSWGEFQDLPHKTSTGQAGADQTSADPTVSKTQVQDFVKTTWDALPKPLRTSPDGQPAPLIVDHGKPLGGLSALGHEMATHFLADGQLQDGDLLVFQARPDKPFSGGSTALGTLRKHIYDQAVEAGLVPHDPTFRFCWVTSFPLFTPADANPGDPGQGGAAGFSSTHHPFTAPLTPADFDLLSTDPLKAKADHYDLVVNGVELGGGSRRIHVAAVQEYVFREVLRMGHAGMQHFEHLLEALRAGCPPHAGFAFGWDRLVATLSYTGSVRDVIAFPKSKKGEEPVARVPGKVGEEEWGVYHLRYTDKKGAEK